MKTLKRLTTLVAAGSLALLGACALTPYTKQWGGYGYSDAPLGADRFRVTFQSVQSDPAQMTVDLALLRGAEVTLAHGYRYFVVLDERRENTQTSYTEPATSTTETSTRTEGNETKTTSKTTYNEAKTVVVNHPSVTQTIRCYLDAPRDAGNAMVYDAQFLWRELGAKYRVKRDPAK